jgi:hypothetical protein
MAGTVYPINKGINKSIEFKGLRAQYIGWLGAGLVVVLLLFTILFIAGLNSFVCVAIAMISGGAVFVYVYKLNDLYGPYGLMRKMAKKNIPTIIICRSRKLLWKSN